MGENSDTPTQGVPRRTMLKGAGALVTGAAIGTIAACDDDPAALDAGSDAGSDTGLDAADTSDTGADLRTDAPGPFPSLQPVRGDGSHPFDYIDTVVIVQMENRSFDHYFGSLSLVEGRTDVEGLSSSILNPRLDGSPVTPQFLEDAWIVHPDPGHGHRASMEQWANGTNSGFVRSWEDNLSDAEMAEKIGWVMGYHTREQLPALYGLADGFTLCDHWHCSLLGPTWPNRFYSHCATSDGEWSNGVPVGAKTPYSMLRDSGGSVGVYADGGIAFMFLLLDFPISQINRLGNSSDFFRDAAEGVLPNVCVVEPDYQLNDDHPPQDIRLGQAYIASVYEALRNSPQWDRSLMLVLYDEHGGFHDHVPPPTVEGDERAAEGFNQLGFRVPGLVAGPLARRGHVMHDLIDHASVPALISRIFGLDQVNERAALAGDLGAALDLELTLNANRPAPPVLPQINLREERIRHGLLQPYGQPELEDWVRRNLGITRPGPDARMRELERYFRVLDDMGVAVVR